MAQPDNMPIARPRGLPADARWDPKDSGFEWVLGAVDSEARRHGPYRFWNRDGVLHGDSTYDHGKTVGKNLNYHPDGSLASEGDWVDDLCRDCVFYRSDKPSPEPWPESGDNVRSVRYYSRDGKVNYTIRFFDAAGVEVGQDGEPLPARPKGVSPDARWFADQDRWVDGAIERGTNAQVGEWRWWDEDGVLRHFERRDAQGNAVESIDYEADGRLDEKTIRLADGGEQRDVFFESGKLSLRYIDDAQDRRIYKGSWYEDGSIDEETVRVFDGDALVSVIERGEDGVTLFEAKRDGDDMLCTLYDNDGTYVEATGVIRDGKLARTWKIFGSDGQLRREIDTAGRGRKHNVGGEGLIFKLGEAAYIADIEALPTPDQLRGVHDIDWDELDGAYEQNVGDFPSYLRALASPDSMVRDYALGMIDGEAEHQGSVYPATAAVIPWLANLMSHPNADRSALLQTIVSYAEAAVPYADDDDDEDGEADDDEDGEADENPANAVVAAVGAAWPQIWPLFETSTKRADRAFVLVIAKVAPEARPMLVTVARDHEDVAFRCCAIDALTGRRGYSVDEIAVSMWDRDPLVRAVTAIRIGLTLGPNAPASVVPALANALRSWRELDSGWAELPFTDGHLLGSLALALGSIRSSDARTLAPLLCADIEETDGASAVAVGRGLLALVLGRGELPFDPAFVDVIHTLAKSDRFWTFNVNAGEVLDSWNLRDGIGDQARTKLAGLVRELRASDDPQAMLHAKMHADDDSEDQDEDDDDDDEN